MDYHTEQRDPNVPVWVIVNSDTNEVVGTRPTKDEADDYADDLFNDAEVPPGYVTCSQCEHPSPAEDMEECEHCGWEMCEDCFTGDECRENDDD